MIDPLENLRLLIARVRQETSNLGLELVFVSLTPGPDLADDYLNIVLMVTPEAVMSAEEKQAKQEFDTLINESYTKSSQSTQLTDSEKEEYKRQLEKLESWLE